MAPAEEGAPQVHMFPDIVSDIPQELYTRRYAPLWSLAMSRPLTHVQYTTATDVSEFDVAQVVDPYFYNRTPLTHAQLLQSSLASFKGTKSPELSACLLLLPLNISAEVRGMVDQCNTALARQPALADGCTFAQDLKAMSKLAGTNAVSVGRLMKGLGGGAGPGWKWTVSEFKCFPVLAAAAAAAASAAANGGA